jgi:signal transduction histidine kinase
MGIRGPLTLLSLLVICLPLRAQAQWEDSVRHVLAESTVPSEQVQLHEALARRLIRTNPQAAYQDALQAFRISQGLENQEISARASMLLGMTLFYLAKHDSSLFYYQNARNYFEDNPDPEVQADLYNLMAMAHSAKDNYADGLQYFALALGMHRRQSDSLGMASIFNNLGNTYRAQGQYYTALEYYRRAIEIYEALDQQQTLARLLSNTAMLYGELKDYTAAKEYLYGALEIQRARKDKHRISILLHNLGSILADQDSLEDALPYFLEVQERLATTSFVRLNWENEIELGAAFRDLGRADTALRIHQVLWSDLEDSGEKRRKANVLYNLALDFKSLGQYEKAKEMGEEAMTLVEEIGARPLKMDICLALSEIYPYLGDFESAHQQLDAYVKLNDSLINAEKNHLLLQWKSQYEMGRQQAEIQYLTEKTELQSDHIKRRNFLAGALALAVVTLIGLGIILYRQGEQKQLTNELLEREVNERTYELQHANALLSQSNQELERFAHLTSHDLKEGMRDINDALTRLGQRLRYFPDDDANEYFLRAKARGQHLATFIRGLQELQSLQAMEIDYKKVDLNEIMPEVLLSLQELIEQKNAQVAWEELPKLTSDPYLLHLILLHLCRNAIQFNDSELPWANVSSQVQDKEVLIIVQDNGLGIERRASKPDF